MCSRLYNKVELTLENNLVPLEKLNQTPSSRDGLDIETEKDLRIFGCELIQMAGILLRLPQVVMATGQVLFQRFFYMKSFVWHNVEIVAISCVFLASKIEETERRIRDVINVFHHIKQKRAQKEITPMILDEAYSNLKIKIIRAERLVLKELGFCVYVKHSHKLIFLYLQVMKLEKDKRLMQLSWNFMNDSLRTDVSARYTPEAIACACIYLCARKLNIPLPNNPPWFGLFCVNIEQIIDICYRVMELYTRPKPNVELLEATVGALKKRYYDALNKAKEAKIPLTEVTIDRFIGLCKARSRSRTPTAIGVSKKPQRAKTSPTEVTIDRNIGSYKARSRSRTPTVIAVSKKRYSDAGNKPQKPKTPPAEVTRSRSRTPTARWISRERSKQSQYYHHRESKNKSHHDHRGRPKKSNHGHRKKSRSRSRSRLPVKHKKKLKHRSRSPSNSPPAKHRKRTSSRDRKRDYHKNKERSSSPADSRNYAHRKTQYKSRGSGHKHRSKHSTVKKRKR